MTGATVSIVIPCYNKRAYVRAAIESALAQSHPCQVVVVDDGSTDGSLAEVQAFDGRILWETGPNRGGSAARNRGLELATGAWIQFLDADDILPEGKIAAQLAALDGAPADAMAFCPWSFFHDDGDIDPPDARRYWHSYDSGADLLVDMWYNGGFFPPHAWLTPRRLIDRAGHWDAALTGDDDGEFFGRMLIAASDMRFCEGTRVLYRDPPEGAVSRDRSPKSVRSFLDAHMRVAEHLLHVRPDRDARKACLSRLRKTGYQLRAYEGVVDCLEAEERRMWLFDPSPSLPVSVRWPVALLGLRRGIRLRHLLEQPFFGERT